MTSTSLVVECPACGKPQSVTYNGMPHDQVYLCKKLSCNQQFSISVQIEVARHWKRERIR